MIGLANITLIAVFVAYVGFVFYPPAFYRRWIRNADPAATVAEG